LAKRTQAQPQAGNLAKRTQESLNGQFGKTNPRTSLKLATWRKGSAANFGKTNPDQPQPAILAKQTEPTTGLNLAKRTEPTTTGPGRAISPATPEKCAKTNT
jgi:hypothetical protein